MGIRQPNEDLASYADLMNDLLLDQQTKIQRLIEDMLLLQLVCEGLIPYEHEKCHSLREFIEEMDSM